MSALLEWRSYRYFDYERAFARREVAKLLGVEPEENERGLVVPAAAAQREQLERLTYFARVQLPEGQTVVPLQARLERSVSARGRRRQSTRYSAHGLHEYRGKFNPQVVRAIGNMLGLAGDAWLLDPFCGSGTTLLEAAHAGWNALGVDRNPLAVHIANAKLHALRSAPDPLRSHAAALLEALSPWLERLSHDREVPRPELDALLGEGWERELLGWDYLSEWFPRSVLAQCVVLRRLFARHLSEPADRSVFEAVASDRLREASWQDPADLRIRRRKQPAPNYPLLSRVAEAIDQAIPRVISAREEIGQVAGRQEASLADSRETTPGAPKAFDAVVTSPPYATALPYIDTQRLSLVLLGMVGAAQLRSTEAALVGARELTLGERKELETQLCDPTQRSLPEKVLALCREMRSAAAHPDNGFRRRNKPALVYRYFRDMAAVFRTIRGSLAPDAPVALVVGSNRTTLGGREFVVDTPALLAEVAEHVGYRRDSLLPMNTYPRYGLHHRNSIGDETLVIVRA